MSAYVVDFQAFKSMCNEFILKEVVITSCNSCVTHHYMVRPPFPFDTITPALRRIVSDFTKHVHGIPWDSGFIQHNEIEKLMFFYLKDASVVYIRGSERARFLKRMLPAKVTVVDLDSFEDIKDAVDVRARCRWGSERHEQLRCSYRKAMKYRNWLRNKFVF